MSMSCFSVKLRIKLIRFTINFRTTLLHWRRCRDKIQNALAYALIDFSMPEIDPIMTKTYLLRTLHEHISPSS